MGRPRLVSWMAFYNDIELNKFNLFRPVAMVQTLIYLLLLIGVYLSSYTWLIQRDWTKEDYNYAYLVPFIGLYLFWERRETLARILSIPSWLGLLPVVFGLGLFWLGELGGEYYTLYFSSWLIMVGLLWTHLGWRKFKHVAFATAFMLAMFPLPNFLNSKITLKLQLISSKLGVAMIQLYGLSAYREGNIIDLGFTQLQVVEACSGLRYLIPLLVLGVLMAYFYKEALWKRILLVISTIPLSIITNSIRIAATGILYETFGQPVAEGFFHGFSGWFIFMFSLGVLLLEMWLLNKVGLKKEIDPIQETEAPDVHQTTVTNPTGHDTTVEITGEVPSYDNPGLMPLTDKHRTKKSFRAIFYPPQFIVTVLLLGVTLALFQGISFHEKIPPKKAFDSFPLNIGKWDGTRELLAQKFITELDFSDYIVANYRNNNGKKVNLYVAYYESQRKGESIHSPASCLPGGGWEFKQSGMATVSLPDGTAISVNRALMQLGDARQVVYYWFPKNGRVLTNVYQLKLYTFWDALTKQRTEAALVRLITPVYGVHGSVEEAEKRLKAFTLKVLPVLAQYLPDA